MINKTLTLVFAVITFSACSQTKKQYSGPAGYDLTKPQTAKMPAELLEISGIAFHNEKADKVYAIQDEDGQLFRLNADGSGMEGFKFGKHGDYEDIAIINNYVIILRSDGTFFNFPVQEVGEARINSVNEFSGLIPKGEYEGLFANKDSKEVWVLCKRCAEDKKKENLSGYVLQLNDSGSLSMKSQFSLNTGAIATLSGAKKTRFSPSAFTYNYTTNEWFVLSSVNKLLVVANKDWSVKEVFPLDPSIFNQPEGITFDIDNNLYISNEGGDAGEGTLLKFPLLKATR